MLCISFNSCSMLCLWYGIIPVCGSWYVLFVAYVMSMEALLYLLFEFVLLLLKLVTMLYFWEYTFFCYIYFDFSSGSMIGGGDIWYFTLGNLEICFLERLGGWGVHTCLVVELFHQFFFYLPNCFELRVPHLKGLFWACFLQMPLSDMYQH